MSAIHLKEEEEEDKRRKKEWRQEMAPTSASKDKAYTVYIH